MENPCWQPEILNAQPRMLKQGHLPWKHCTSRLVHYIKRLGNVINLHHFVQSLSFCLLQVMPFLLRRTKAEVLSDLPEKIIQDRYCDLSNVQLKLYEQFSGSQVREDITSMVKVNEVDHGEEISASKASSHVFQVNFRTCTSEFSIPFYLDMLFISFFYASSVSGTSILAKTL